MIVLCGIILSSCTANAIEIDSKNHYLERDFYVSKVVSDHKEEVKTDNNEEVRAIWVSQFDMKPIYRDGNKQRDKDDYTQKVRVLISNLKRDGFNTVFLQLRPNGDSMYESRLFPYSKYVSGVYGGSIDYDVIEIFLSIAEESGISVHAWINPFRLCSEEEMKNGGFGKLYQWYKDDIGRRIKKGDDGLLYLDPYYAEATELIVDGAKEILDKYDFDGIHIDDYFYPTEFEFDDEKEFISSGLKDKGEFRRDNISRTVKALYDAVHEYEGKVFGVSPAGNIYSLPKKWYADIYKWCSNDGYVDYIVPQLYFGFENAVCPFEKILEDWGKAVTNEKIKLYIGLSAAKCVDGALSKEDKFAGEKGKFEWRDNKDILSRSVEEIYGSEKATGFAVFTYSSFYDPLTGKDNDLITEEKTAFLNVTQIQQ